jgi:hypothetical protein
VLFSFFPTQFVTLKNLGAALNAKEDATPGEREDALKTMLAALELDSADLVQWMRAGDLAAELGHLVSARRCFEGALTLSSGHVPALLRLSEVAYLVGDLVTAASLCGGLLRRHPTHRHALLLLHELTQHSPVVLQYASPSDALRRLLSTTGTLTPLTPADQHHLVALRRRALAVEKRLEREAARRAESAQRRIGEGARLLQLEQCTWPALCTALLSVCEEEKRATAPVRVQLPPQPREHTPPPETVTASPLAVGSSGDCVPAPPSQPVPPPSLPSSAQRRSALAQDSPAAHALACERSPLAESSCAESSAVSAAASSADEGSDGTSTRKSGRRRSKRAAAMRADTSRRQTRARTARPPLTRNEPTFVEIVQQLVDTGKSAPSTHASASSSAHPPSGAEGDLHADSTTASAAQLTDDPSVRTFVRTFQQQQQQQQQQQHHHHHQQEDIDSPRARFLADWLSATLRQLAALTCGQWTEQLQRLASRLLSAIEPDSPDALVMTPLDAETLVFGAELLMDQAQVMIDRELASATSKQPRKLVTMSAEARIASEKRHREQLYQLQRRAFSLTDQCVILLRGSSIQSSAPASSAPSSSSSSMPSSVPSSSSSPTSSPTSTSPLIELRLLWLRARLASLSGDQRAAIAYMGRCSSLLSPLSGVPLPHCVSRPLLDSASLRAFGSLLAAQKWAARLSQLFHAGEYASVVAAVQPTLFPHLSLPPITAEQAAAASEVVRSSSQRNSASLVNSLQRSTADCAAPASVFALRSSSLSAQLAHSTQQVGPTDLLRHALTPTGQLPATVERQLIDLLSDTYVHLARSPCSAVAAENGLALLIPQLERTFDDWLSLRRQAASSTPLFAGLDSAEHMNLLSAVVDRLARADLFWQRLAETVYVDHTLSPLLLECVHRIASLVSDALPTLLDSWPRPSEPQRSHAECRGFLVRCCQWVFRSLRYKTTTSAKAGCSAYTWSEVRHVQSYVYVVELIKCARSELATVCFWCVCVNVYVWMCGCVDVWMYKR